MRELKENACLVCGKNLKQPLRGRRRKYCNDKCRNTYFNRKNRMKPKLSAGVAKCVQCGNEFERSDNSSREFCSRLCGLAWGRRCAIEEIRQLVTEEKQKSNPCKLRDWALELHYNGYENKAITEALGFPEERIKTWVKRYARESDGKWTRIMGDREKEYYRERRRRINNPRFRQSHYAYLEAQTAPEWLLVLRGRAKDKQHYIKDSVLESRSIFIVCGVTNIRKNADSLCTIVQYGLHMNPFEGDVFAFCGINRNQIRYMYWDGSGFRVMLRTRERGTYPWPGPKLGSVISITAEDFEYMLRGESDVSKHSRYFINWNSIEIPKAF